MDLVEFVKSPWTWAALVPLAFFTLLFCTALFEHVLIRPYVPAPDDENYLAPIPGEADPMSIVGLPRTSQISDYVGTMSVAIHAAGFEYHGLVAHAKAPRIQILATVWMSPDRTMIVSSGSGTVLKMPAYQTRIYTPLKDGGWLLTTDNTDAGDPSRQFKFRRVINGQFREVLDLHLKRMAQYGDRVGQFAQASAVDAMFAMFDAHVQLLVKKRLARYLDKEKTRYSYTPRGGLLVCVGFFEQLGGALTQFWRVRRNPIASPTLKMAMPKRIGAGSE